MAVNVWNNILVALKSKLRAGMKCPVFSGDDKINKSNQFIKLVPTGSIQGDVTKFSEHRTFNIDVHYYIINQNNTQFEKYKFNQVSILEALVHDNPTLSLADSTTAYNVMIGDNDLNIEPDEEFDDYIILGWNFSCEHLNNLG